MLLAKGRAGWLFSVLVAALTLFASILLIIQVNDKGTLSYMLGGWDAPWGIEYRIDYLNAFVLTLISAIGFITLVAAKDAIKIEIDAKRQPLFYVSFLLCLAGLLGIAATGDAFNVFVFLEISSLAMYSIIALGRDRRALWAAYQYLIVGTIGATFILIGIGLMYMMTGTLNMLDLAERLPSVVSSKTVLASYAFILVGVSLKLALFPLHFWLPNAYTYAPSIVTAFLAATATKVAVYLLIRFNFSVYDLSSPELKDTINSIFLTLGIAATLFASWSAIKQSNLKRMLAYSSVAQIGYMIIGIGLDSTTGVQASILHLFNHALMKGGLFLTLIAIAMHTKSTELNDLKGVAKAMPWTFAGFVIGGLSLIGVPLTAGFISKWYLVKAAAEQSQWLVIAFVLLGSLLAVIYIWRVVEAAWFKTDTSVDRSNKLTRTKLPLALTLSLWALVLSNLFFGINTSFTVYFSEQAATLMLGGN
ncbi:monovalent cation/H+ antiporter subunit D family protein [Pleionea litopenaei]|uniref:Monovalent cation/H+ antiporter subunit D family protein n=1 Tax=Pleionea litopenaei TaxID=3070815 RepID=A0AA51RUJ6_9GAMM|nr:monovalent cation/H+ antiporter subunit D family protein [Pleionea sp. HL-JVS1]WMS87840.1 monovalent cation/H+ antiporter subunit D family protein [Pleionea sp. HL-JVS1]